MRFILLFLCFIASIQTMSQGTVMVITDTNSIFFELATHIYIAGCEPNLNVFPELSTLTNEIFELEIYDDLSNSNSLIIDPNEQYIVQDIACEYQNEVQSFIWGPNLNSYLIFSCFPETESELGKIILSPNIPWVGNGGFCAVYATATLTDPSGDDVSSFGNVYDFLENGLYTCSVINGNTSELMAEYVIDLSPSDTPYQYYFDFSCDDLVGINTIEDKIIELSPNPVINDLNIANVNEDLLLTFYNSNGKTVLSETINTDKVINIESLPSGLYLIVFDNQKGRQITRKVQIQH